MDLKREILREHSKAMAHRIADYVGKNRNRFQLLTDIYFAGPYRITQRAAYPLGVCAERHPELIVPHLAKFISSLKQDGIHNAVKRNTLRMLQFIEIPRRYHATLISYCFAYLQNKQEPTAVKVFAMTVLSKIIRDQPDLQKELRIILEDNLPYASAGFLSRARKILRGVNSL